VVQSTSPWFAPRSFWCIDATLREAGFTHPYHAHVPSFGEWGFNLATRQPGYTPPPPTACPPASSTRHHPADVPFPRHAAPARRPNHLNDQRLVHYFQQDWGNVVR
jgi:spermidine synthase